MMSKITLFIHRLEDILLFGSLLAMLLIGVFQMAMRNFFDAGIVWGDTLVRILILWLGLVGAMAASRKNQHISIDVVTRYLPERYKRTVNAGVAFATAAICATATWYGAQFVRMEFLDGEVAFGNVPVWACGLIIPVCFGTLTLRYLHTAAASFFSRAGQPL
jgi:TRAP-type C4-dicarboxylate transport system permease small subunit